MRYKMELEKRESAGLWSHGDPQMPAETIWACAEPGLTVNTGHSARRFLTTISSTNTWAAS